jgi:hypothetical protein
VLYRFTSVARSMFSLMSAQHCFLMYPSITAQTQLELIIFSSFAPYFTIMNDIFALNLRETQVATSGSGDATTSCEQNPSFETDLEWLHEGALWIMTSAMSHVVVTVPP